jgi:hypothetical protein
VVVVLFRQTLLVVSTAFVVESVAAQAIADFSGTWVLDRGRSGQGVDVWGQTRAAMLEISQDGQDIRVAMSGGGIPAAPECLRFPLDGTALECVDASRGELPNFVRKVRTDLIWDGQSLTLRAEHFSEHTERGRITRRRAITSVLALRLLDARTLRVERTGFRAEPPATLHGRPYAQDEDLAYNTDVVVYARRAP